MPCSPNLTIIQPFGARVPDHLQPSQPAPLYTHFHTVHDLYHTFIFLIVDLARRIGLPCQDVRDRNACITTTLPQPARNHRCRRL